MFFIMFKVAEKDSGSSIHQPTCSIFLWCCFALLARSLGSETFMWIWKWELWLCWCEQPPPTFLLAPWAPKGAESIDALMSPSLWNIRQIKAGTVGRAGFRLWAGIGAGAPPRPGSCCACRAAWQDSTNSQDRDHLGNEHHRNGSLPSYDTCLVPHQSNAYGTVSLLAVSAKHCSVGCPSSWGF